MSRATAFRVSSNLIFIAATSYGLAALLSQLIRERLEPEPVGVTAAPGQSNAAPPAELQAEPLARMFGIRPQPEPPSEPQAPPIAPSSFQVLATMVATPPGFSMALVSMMVERRTILVEIGTILGTHEVVRIERDPALVVLRERRTGKELPITSGLPPPTSLAAIQPVVSSLDIEHSSSGEVSIPLPKFEAMLADLGKLATQVRVMPATRGGQSVGLTFQQLQAGSPLAQLGLHPGDTLTSVNGIELRSPEQWMDAYTRLRSSRDFALSVERGGVPTQLRVRIR